MGKRKSAKTPSRDCPVRWLVILKAVGPTGTTFLNCVVEASIFYVRTAVDDLLADEYLVRTHLGIHNRDGWDIDEDPYELIQLDELLDPRKIAISVRRW